MSMGSATEGKLGTVIVAVGWAVSAGVLLLLLSANIASTQKLRASRIVGTMVPASGALLGQYPDGSEWAPFDGKDHSVVLFGVAEEDQVGDLEYWRDIAMRSRAVVPDVHFVGLCSTEEVCGLMPSETAPLTILKSMRKLPRQGDSS